jgi:tetratricopeptide (TPR) repeat protein
MKNFSFLFIFCFFFTTISAQTAQDLYKEGNELLKNKQAEAAIAKYNKALELDSNLIISVGMNRAKAFMELKKWSDAVKDFDKVISKDAKNSDA